MAQDGVGVTVVVAYFALQHAASYREFQEEAPLCRQAAGAWP